ncbi:MAG TPA: multiheme c-type cytochrome [Candidatus Angelobacter sp.]|jgi:hypothetical protein|nr:multiheme c-type cytochrome [Candidatus Angelobacter sp.]
MAQLGVRRNACCSCILAITFLSCFSALAVAAQEKSGAGKYNGPGSCAASACHGGVQVVDEQTRAKTRTHIWQNEYFIWATQDPHFKAFSALQTDRSRQISHLLGRSKAPAQDENCLGCHALTPSPELQARDFGGEGVSCESCHAAASGWFEKHFQRKTTTEESIRSGMYPIRDTVQRSVKCLSCHLGTAKYEVDHQMIAAGHPDLFFELDLFSAKQPRHWPLPDEMNYPDVPKDPNYGVRLWAVGQAVQLREALSRLARRAERAQQPDSGGQRPQWPELSELDCFSCHHSVNSNWRDPNYDEHAPGSHPKGLDSWRQKRGYDDRTPGSPPWNSAHYTIFRTLLRTIDPDDSTKLETELRSLYQVASRLNSSPQEVGKQARQTGTLAGSLVDKVVSEFKNPPSQSKRPLLGRLMLEISAEGERIANQDTRSAEQAYMALDSLFRSYDGIKSGERLNTGAHPAVGVAIEALYSEFDNPSAYDAPRFAARMRKVNEALSSVKDMAVKKQLQSGIARKLQIR